MPQTQYTFRNLDVFMESDLLAYQDDQQTAELFEILNDDSLCSQKLEAQIIAMLNSLDWDRHREPIAQLVSKLLPFESLVPPVYEAWKPIVKEAVIFIASRLPPERLIPKLARQISHPDTPLELRFVQFVEQMPTLQKLGQIIARNKNLDPRFRSQLTLLENSIRDVTAKELQTVIKRRLRKKLIQYRVELEEVIHSEASVSAVVRFRWRNPHRLRFEDGILKVQKPGIAKNFKSEIKILEGLGSHLDQHDNQHLLSQVDLRGLLVDIKSHLLQELDARREQANLRTAQKQYHRLPGVRVPELIEALCTPTITAMSFENGCKVTDAYLSNHWRKNELATKVVKTLIANPLYSSDETTLFHADPHAGNLFVDENTHELLILDWSLTEKLSTQERKSLLLLLSAIFLRDEQLIFQFLSDLSSNAEEKTEALYRTLDKFLRALPPVNLPTLNQVLKLLDDLGLEGIQFSKGLVIFRKVLLTLDGVLKDIGGNISLESTLAHYAFKEWIQRAWGLKGLEMLGKPCLLSTMDSISLMQSAQWFGLRTGIHIMSKLIHGPGIKTKE